jgi:hypothetical protein
MLARCLLTAAAGLLPLACSSGSAEPGDASLIVPEGLAVTALPGGNGVLELFALTLQEGARGSELYVALENVGDVPACSAAVAVELFDHDEQPLAAGIGGLHTQHLYRLTDGSDTIAACVGPGDVTMAAVTDLPAELALQDVGTVVYRCPYFALDVAPIDGLAMKRLERVTRDTGTAYTGTLVNEVGVAVRRPSVTVFPINAAGRPLGVATGQSSDEMPPGERWDFETGAVDVPASDFVAYPAASFAGPS